jgi:alpha 1,3-mannosyltransferase
MPRKVTGDSAVVVWNKGKLPVFTGLLHICWQKTQVVREDITCKMMYGDRESWWFGLELCGVPTFEKHYGAAIGEIITKRTAQMFADSQ